MRVTGTPTPLPSTPPLTTPTTSHYRRRVGQTHDVRGRFRGSGPSARSGQSSGHLSVRPVDPLDRRCHGDPRSPSKPESPGLSPTGPEEVPTGRVPEEGPGCDVRGS